jgi:hypothetical protein
MKFKTLKRKDTGEFIVIDEINGVTCFFTSEIPRGLNSNVEYGDIAFYYSTIYPEFDITLLELVEYDMVDTAEIGADIRNKLTPIKNLLALLKLQKDLTITDENRIKIQKLIDDSAEQSDISLKYLTNLL